MRVDQIGFMKERQIINTIARNTSCNSGWLRLAVQIMFGILIASSFLMIMLMVIGRPSRNRLQSTRCSIANCRVTCTEAPQYGDYEDDVINAASEADLNCDGIILNLVRPAFINFQIPEDWLSGMRADVRELAITGGNLKNIAPNAFISPFSNNIRVLSFEEIEIHLWDDNMFVGLNNLNRLFLRDCMLHDIRSGALSALSTSLQFLDIRASEPWDPVNVTGSTRLLNLNVVDFSSNNFHDILRNASFSMIRACKVLYLNSCGIVSLEPGTFDYLESIEDLFLNDNYLVTVPVGLFDRILPRRPLIALHENYWHCTCSNEDLRSLVRKKLLPVDPICHYPETMAGTTFTDFEEYCNTHQINEMKNSDQSGVFKSNNRNSTGIVYINGACHERNTTLVNQLNDNPPLQIIAPSEHQTCLLNRISKEDIKSITSDNDLVSINRHWIQPEFFAQSIPYSIVEIKLSAVPGYGLLWYQSSCTIIYCVNTIPTILKLFNLDLGNFYTFCPFNLSSGAIRTSHCVSYDLAKLERDFSNPCKYHELILYICLSLGCLLFGALCVYGIIHRNPTLLRGSKRVLLVKHKSIEALILPPKVPLRTIFNESNEQAKHSYGKKNIFILPNKPDTCVNLPRSISIKSNESSDASYISAIQPTEEQLSEWRSNQIVKQFDNAPSSDYITLPYSRNCEHDSLPYYSYRSDERIYEVPKQY